VYVFYDYASFYGEELLAPRPTPKLGYHPLSAVRHAYPKYSQLPSILEAVLHPQPEDATCRGDMDPFIVGLLNASADRAFVLADGTVHGICSIVEQKEP